MLCGISRNSRASRSEDQQNVKGLRLLGSQRDANSHAEFFGFRKVGHPFHAVIDRQITVGLRRRRFSGIGTGGEPNGNRVAGLMHHQSASGVAKHVPAIRQHARQRRSGPGIGLRLDVGKINWCRQRLIVGKSFGKRVRIERSQDADDPGSAASIEAISKLAPGEFPALVVLAGAPGLLPKMFAPGQLVFRQFRLVSVCMNLVGIDAHAQFRAVVRLEKESRLEPHRQHDNGHAGDRR